MGLHVARLCFDILLEDGLAAKIACESQAVSPAFSRIVEANILLSAIGFESGGLAAAHSIHNGLTALEETHAPWILRASCPSQRHGRTSSRGRV